MEEQETISRWTKAEKEEMARAPYDRDVLRALVDFRLSAQGVRKSTGNQIWAVEQRVDTTPDPGALGILHKDQRTCELKADKAITFMVTQHEAGRWAISIEGVSYIFAGVLLSQISIRPWKCNGGDRDTCNADEPHGPECGRIYVNTAGKVWRFAGLDGDAKRQWLAQAKPGRRPWNALLKRTAWQIGESFKKRGADSDCLYARLYRQRKALEIERNEAGEFREQALGRLELAAKKKWKVTKDQHAAWDTGRLQPLGLDLRAGRVAAKMFLSHFHHVLHVVEEGECPPVPYALGPGGHADFVAIPRWNGCPHGDHREA